MCGCDMELIFIVLWTVVLLLGYRLWVLWIIHGSFPQILKKLSDGIRSRVRELNKIQENFYRLEQPVHVRKVSETTAEKFAQAFQECFQKKEFSVDCLEPFEDSLSAMDGPVPRPGSIMWKGLPFYLQRFHLVPGRCGAERRCRGGSSPSHGVGAILPEMFEAIGGEGSRSGFRCSSAMPQLWTILEHT